MMIHCRGTFLVVVILLVVICKNVTGDGARTVSLGVGSGNDEFCSLEKSRIARNLVEAHILTPLAAIGYDIPMTCPFHPKLDAMATLESKKKLVRKGNWKCLACLKTYKEESELDLHLGRRHRQDVSTIETTCLSNFCDILQCDKSASSQYKIQVFSSCDSKNMEKLRLFCISTMHRCFPPTESDELRKVHDRIHHRFCSRLTCDDLPAVNDEDPGLVRLWTIFGIAFAIICLGFYICAYFYYRDVAFKDDLQRLSRQRKKNTISFWTNKLKGY